MKAQQITKQSDKVKAMFLSWLEENDHIITERDAERMYEDMLDEYPVVIGSLEYSCSHVLQKVDPIAYRCGFLDYVDSLGLDQLCDYGMDSDDYVEDIDSLWDDFEDEMPEAPAIYKLPCSYTGLDAEIDNCDPPAIIVGVEHADDPMSAGCVDRYITTDGRLIDCSINSAEFADWFGVDELEEFEY